MGTTTVVKQINEKKEKKRKELSGGKNKPEEGKKKIGKVN